MMIELLKKITWTGLGLAFLTKEKLEEAAKEIIDKGKLSEQEAKDFIEELKKKSLQAKEDLEKLIEERVNNTIKKMNLATHDDLLNLEEQIKALKQGEKDQGAEK